MRTAQSSHIQAYDYDPGTGDLMIQFVNGAVYHYAGVPATEYYNFSQSSSPGIYFHSKIKNQYATTNIAPAPPKQRGMR